MAIGLTVDSAPGRCSMVPLAVIGDCLTRAQVLAPLWSGLACELKTYRHPAWAKLQDVVVAIMAGCRSLAQVNTRLRPERALAAAWQREVFAEQSNLSRTLEALRGALFASYIAAGQTCIQGARLIVHERLYERFAERFAERARTIRLGDPLDPETQMGPVSSCRQFDRVLSYISQGREEGARVLVGGGAVTEPPYDRGYFIAPTVFADVRPDVVIAQDEIFGPVTVLIPFRSEEEAVVIANQSRYGLGASVWTGDVTRAHRVAHRLEVGVVWINDHHRIDPAMPWGGFKESCIGREVGLQAYRAFTKTQSVVVKLSDEPFDWYGGSSRYS